MSKLLFNVAKELNVGTTTIVEFLAKKGHNLENKPIAKVSDEMYKELAKQFQSSIADKEKASQVVIGTRPMQAKKEDTPPVIIKRDKPVLQINIGKQKEEAPKPVEKQPVAAPAPIVAEQPKPTVTESPKKEEVSTPTVAPTTPKSNAPEVMERQKIELRGPKVLGKINLDAPRTNNNPSSGGNKPAERRDDNRRDDRRPNNNNNNNNNNQRNDGGQRGQGQQGGGQNRNQQPSQQQPRKRQEDVIISSPKIEPIPTVAPDAPEFYRAEAPTLKGLKILGKITIEEKPSPAKKRDNRGPNRGGPQGSAGGSADEKRKRKRKKVSQPLTEDAVKRIGAANQGSGNGQGGNNTNNTGNNNNNNRPAGQGGGQGQNRPAGQGGFNNNRPAGQGGGQGQNRPAGQGGFNNNRPAGQGGGFNNNRPGGNAAPREISQKDIDDQIKATMARLGGGGKKTRQKIRRDKRSSMREKEDLRREAGENGKLQLTEFVSVSELASLLDVSVTEVITTCFNLGVIVSINQRLDAEVLEFIAGEFGFEIEFISAEEQVEVDESEIDSPEDLLPRSPIVTVMGHVDHGKTSLLDNIRKANVVSGEAGGITQHIGAYEVKLADGKRITFLDTPGHEAFTAMRARGAKVTDIAIIIISADDNIMPQTREAIAHAQAAGVPMIFAINKIDKAGADPERIKNELAQMNLLVEDWGGKYQSQDISAKKNTNIDLLLEKILLEAELLDLKANPNKRALGTVIEASLDKGRGYVTKILVQEGTLNEGDPIVAGEHSGKIKAMFNELGIRVKKAGPSVPVLVLGLSGAPQAGEKFKETATEAEARQSASKRAQISREQSNRASKRISLDEIGRRLALGNFKELKLIIKGDVDGSVEALADSLIKQSIESVQVNVIHKAVGGITDSDIVLASASDAIIIGFQVRPSLSARKLAEQEGVEIKHYSIIYEAIDEIRAAIEGLLEPTKEEKIEATVEIREVYTVSKVGTIAGCYVQEGKLMRNNFIRVIRDGIVVFPVKEGANGKLGSLKHYKDDVKEIRPKMECGLTIEGFNDMRVGDIIESYEIVEVKQKLK